MRGEWAKSRNRGWRGWLQVIFVGVHTYAKLWLKVCVYVLLYVIVVRKWQVVAEVQPIFWIMLSNEFHCSLFSNPNSIVSCRKLQLAKPLLADVLHWNELIVDQCRNFILSRASNNNMLFLRSTVQNFSFVMVNADAVRSFGFCRSAPNADTALVSNLLIVEESHKSIFITLVTLKFRPIKSRSWYRVFRGTKRSTSCSTTRPSSLCLPTPAN